MSDRAQLLDLQARTTGFLEYVKGAPAIEDVAKGFIEGKFRGLADGTATVTTATVDVSLGLLCSGMLDRDATDVLASSVLPAMVQGQPDLAKHTITTVLKEADKLIFDCRASGQFDTDGEPRRLVVNNVRRLCQAMDAVIQTGEVECTNNEVASMTEIAVRIRCAGDQAPDGMPSENLPLLTLCAMVETARSQGCKLVSKGAVAGTIRSLVRDERSPLSPAQTEAVNEIASRFEIVRPPQRPANPLIVDAEMLCGV